MYLCAHGGAGFLVVLIPRLAGRALLNPRIAWDLLTMTWAFRRRRWWAAPPFLPLPDRTYLELAHAHRLRRRTPRPSRGGRDQVRSLAPEILKL